MKLIFILVLSFFCASAVAQQQIYRGAFSAHIGANQYNFIHFDEISIGEKDQNIPIPYVLFGGSNGPTVQLAYDRSLQKRFSLGISAAYHSLHLDFSGLRYKSDVEIAGSGTIRQSHISLQIRPQYHFIKKRQLDMYSGLSMGVGIWTAQGSGDFSNKQARNLANNTKLLKINAFFFSIGSIMHDNHPVKLRGTGTVPQFAVTLLGLRGYFNKHWGAGFEIGTGTPVFVSGGLEYRF